MAKPSRIKEIEFGKKLTLKSKVEAIYSETVVPSGTSARINAKSNFLHKKVLVIVLPEDEEVLYTTR